MPLTSVAPMGCGHQLFAIIDSITVTVTAAAQRVDSVSSDALECLLGGASNSYQPCLPLSEIATRARSGGKRSTCQPNPYDGDPGGSTVKPTL